METCEFHLCFSLRAAKLRSRAFFPGYVADFSALAFCGTMSQALLSAVRFSCAVVKVSIDLSRLKKDQNLK